MDINCRGSIPDNGEDVSYSWWYVDEALWWDYHGTVGGRGEPEVKCVICYDSQ